MITWPMPIVNVPEPPTVQVIRRELLAYTPQTDGSTGSLRSTESVPDGQLSALNSPSHAGGRPRIMSVRRTPCFRANWPSRVRLGKRLENVAWAAADNFVFIRAGVGIRKSSRSPNETASTTELDRLAEDRAGATPITPKQGQSRQPGQQMSDRGDEQ